MLNALRKFSVLLGRFFGLPFYYGVMLLCFGYWFFQWQKFRGVETWPKVPARIVAHDSYSVPYRVETHTGSRSGSHSGGSVTFEYVVGGRTYQSSYGSPNGGGLPVVFDFGEDSDRPWNESWDAYYKPSEPGLAVLSPVPYKGIAFLAIGTVFALIVSVHLFFLIVGKMSRTQARELVDAP